MALFFFCGTATNFVSVAGMDMYNFSTAANGIRFNATIHSNGHPYIASFSGGLTSAGLYESTSAPSIVILTGPFTGTLTVSPELATLWGMGTTSQTYGGLYSYEIGGALQNGSVVTFDLDPKPVPIPSSLVLLAAGFFGLIGMRKRSRP